MRDDVPNVYLSANLHCDQACTEAYERDEGD